MGFPDGSLVKNPPVNARDTGDLSSTHGSGRSPGGGNGSLLILPGIIPWTEESGRPQSMGSTKIELTEHAHKDKHFFD